MGKSDDPITDAVLGESTYDRLRALRFGVFKQAIHRKLAWQSYLLLSLAALLPIAAALPDSTRMQYLTGELALASPKLAVLGFAGALLLVLTGLGHAGVAVRRLAREPNISEFEAEQLLAAENVCSTLGLGTATLAVVITHAGFALGFGGASAVATYIDVMGADPFAASNLPLSLGTIMVVSLLGAVVLQLLSAFVFVESLSSKYASVDW
jgi:hypothetical protein